MANEVLRNAAGEIVPQQLTDGATITASDLNSGDDSQWEILQDLATQTTLSNLKSVIGSQNDSAVTDSTTPSTEMAFIKGMIFLMNDGVAVDTDGGTGNFDIDSLPTPVAVEGQNGEGETLSQNAVPLAARHDTSPSAVGNGEVIPLRTNEVGDLSITTLAPGDDTVEAAESADTVVFGGSAYTVQTAFVSANTASEQTVATAGSGESVVLLSYEVTVAAPHRLELLDGSGGPLLDAVNAGGNSGIVKDPTGHILQTSDATDLILSLGSGNQTDFRASYVVV